jgi:hypothetical protein
MRSQYRPSANVLSPFASIRSSRFMMSAMSFGDSLARKRVAYSVGSSQ